MEDGEGYLKKHEIASLLNGIVNDLARDQPADPISFLINGLLKEANERGVETALLQRLAELRLTLVADQKDAAVSMSKTDKLAAENEKLNYRVSHLCKALNELEKSAGAAGGAAAAAAPASSAVPKVTGVPLGHTSFSWAGGVDIAAPPAGSPAAGAAGALVREKFSQRVLLSKIFSAGESAVGASISVSGWARTVRVQKEMAFVALNDGSRMENLQLVLTKAESEGWEDLAASGATGCAICATGELVASPAAGQAVEMKVASIAIVGPSDGATYPLAKKAHTLEHLRSISHMRPRTNTIAAVMRIRNVLSYATHSFFQQNGFMYVNSPLITGADCEGAGEMFQVTTLDVNKPPRNADGSVNYGEDFFGQPSYLTVSGQLNAEHYACAFGSVYTFGPTFRAENSHTTRHLAEFWMIEPEIAFADIVDDMNCAEGFLQFALTTVLERCADDLAFLQKHYDPQLIETLRHVSTAPFERLTYTEAVEICAKSGKKWEFKPEWGAELQTEHERYLAEEVYKKPVIVYNYPKDCKAFYMRVNDDNRTVAAMDVLFPKLGEMVGGSQREERLDVLLARMQEMGLKQEDYEAYLDLRRYGTQKHAGFGVGFERLVTYATGMGNIRDVIPFPRAPGQMQN